MKEDEALETYLNACAERQARLRASKKTDMWLRRLTKYLVPIRLRGTARVLATTTIAPIERRKAQALLAKTPIFLHLGSGGEHKEGWVNIDLAGDPVELAWNLAKQLPFPDASVDAIFHEHLLEHIPLAGGISLLRECYRVLKPNGILRIGVPDAGVLLQAYFNHNDAYLNKLHPNCPTRMLAVQELFYWHRHCTMFDEETLALAFRTAGFPHPQSEEFGNSRISIAPDTPQRKAETFYMEDTKPVE